MSARDRPPGFRRVGLGRGRVGGAFAAAAGFAAFR